MNLKNLIIVFLILIFIYVFYVFFYDGTVEYLSQVDGRYYRIRRGSDMQTRADNLALIRLKLNKIVDALRKDPAENTKVNVKRLINNWSDDIGIKEIGLMENDAAYVIDKHHMSFCLRTSPSGGNLESLNLLTYVAIHEQAHVMSIEIGHGNEFNANFKYLLNYAKTLKYTNPLTGQEEDMYVPIEPATNADDSNFCGVHISANAVR